MKCIRCGKEMTPTTGGNYYCLQCDIYLNDLVYRTTTTNFLQTDDDKIIESKTEYYCIKCEEKDQRIKELEKENENRKKLGLALYTALAKELEKQGLTDDIPSVIDQLVGKNCGEYANMYNEYKNQKQELALYKKALELACESVVKHEKRVDEEMGIVTFFGETFDYNVSEFVEHYLQQAKEKIDEQKTDEKE